MPRRRKAANCTCFKFLNIKPLGCQSEALIKEKFMLFASDKRKTFLSFAAKRVCHEGAKAGSRKMLRIFLCAFES
jgi:hypothetical protein